MSKMKQLDLLMQEVVDECEEMRWENEGIGLSDVQVKIVEYAFMQGFHAAGKLAVRPTQEKDVEDEPEDKCGTCNTPIVYGGDWGYCTPCFNKLSDEYWVKHGAELLEKR
jgi:hypothetical protein